MCLEGRGFPSVLSGVFQSLKFNSGGFSSLFLQTLLPPHQLCSPGILRCILQHPDSVPCPLTPLLSWPRLPGPSSTCEVFMSSLLPSLRHFPFTARSCSLTPTLPSPRGLSSRLLHIPDGAAPSALVSCPAFQAPPLDGASLPPGTAAAFVVAQVLAAPFPCGLPQPGSGGVTMPRAVLSLRWKSLHTWNHKCPPLRGSGLFGGAGSVVSLLLWAEGPLES